MASIVLATLNARYHHCAFGLRYLLANMGDLQEQTRLLEFTINQPTLDVLGEILSHKPHIVGLGVYIWNVDETTRLVADLKRVAPEIIVVLGGPEVSYETDQQEIVQLSDFGEQGVDRAEVAVVGAAHQAHARAAVRWRETQAQELAGLAQPMITPDFLRGLASLLKAPEQASTWSS